jgi:hypothetical protein
MSLPKNEKNIIVLREGWISPYTESLPQPHVNYIEEDMGVYYIFLEEDSNFVLPSLEPEYGMWHMRFNGAFSSEGNGACIILYAYVGKIHTFSYILEFPCTNNVT